VSAKISGITQFMENFKSLGLSDETLEALRLKGFTEPTPIQQLTIPRLLQGENDVIGQAQTGTGKTAAFGLPLIEQLDPRSKNIGALVLTPTRELALQVCEEIDSLKGSKKLRVCSIYGGMSYRKQIEDLDSHPHIVVGTPGRILDHLERGTLKIKNLQFFVLDEADEMLNMGFIEDIETILGQTNSDKRMLFFSATMPESIMNLAKTFMQNMEVLKVAKKDLTTHLTRQIFYYLRNKDQKFSALRRVVDAAEEFYGLVFCRTKSDSDELAQKLGEKGYSSEALHGDLSQAQREKILEKFKRKKITILTATDVAARGIDINNLTHVVNYTIPDEAESYVHRIGRTGRAGREGLAISLVTPKDVSKLRQIEKQIKVKIEEEELPSLEQVIEAKKSKIITELNQSAEKGIKPHYEKAAKDLLENMSPEWIVSALLQLHYGDLMDSELIEQKPNFAGKSRYGSETESREPRGRRESPRFYDDEKPTRARRESRGFEDESEMTRMKIMMGKKEGFTPRKLVEFLEMEVKTRPHKITNIVMSNDYSLFSVPTQEAGFIMNKLKRKKKGSEPLMSVMG
jgi:ATP-dependent RNA helicase DeaD